MDTLIVITLLKDRHFAPMEEIIYNQGWAGGVYLVAGWLTGWKTVIQIDSAWSRALDTKQILASEKLSGDRMLIWIRQMFSFSNFNISFKFYIGLFSKSVSQFTNDLL